MNYELALALKENGFPQTRPVYLSGRTPNEVFVSYPTLEELIEACGEGFNTLSRDTSTSTTCWVVNNYSEIDAPEETVLGWFEGKTPIEAVARLWLVINKKT